MLKIDTGRQEVTSAVLTLDAVNSGLETGVVQEAILIPGGAVVVGGTLDTLVPFNSATSDTIELVVDGQTLLAAQDVAAVGNAALAVPTSSVNKRWVTVEWTGVGAVPTEGTVRAVVQYVIPGKATHSEG